MKFSLRECFEARQLVEMEKRRLELLTTTRARMTAPPDGQPRARGFDSGVEKIALAIVDTETRLRELEAELAFRQAQMLTWILSACLPAAEENVAVARYVHCAPFAEIAQELCYSLPHVYRLHREVRAKLLTYEAAE